MQLIYNKIFLDHDTGHHPENRKRLECLGSIKETDIPFIEEYLYAVHSGDHVQRVKEVSQKSGHLDPDTVVSKGSYEAAVYAVGATVLASEEGGFALVRPPGHHAYPNKASGFCLFNNIAIATQLLLKQGKRVLILDIDGHLGDGTERIFYHTDKVLYCSLHQFPAFPHCGSEEEIGEDEGTGFSVNVPLPPLSGDDNYFKAFEKVLEIAKQFKPDIVGISAGFDAHQADRILDLRLSASAYYKIGQLISQNFANIFATLEGGYYIEMLPKCLNNFVRGINGESIFYEERSTESTIQVIDELDMRMSHLEKELSEYWNF